MDFLFSFPVFMENLDGLLNAMNGKLGLCARSLFPRCQKTVLAPIHPLVEGARYQKIGKDKEKAIYNPYVNWNQPGAIH